MVYSTLPRHCVFVEIVLKACTVLAVLANVVFHLPMNRFQVLLFKISISG